MNLSGKFSPLCAMAPPDFGRLANPILGGKIMPITLLPPPIPLIFNPSYGPAIYTELMDPQCKKLIGSDSLCMVQTDLLASRNDHI